MPEAGRLADLQVPIHQLETVARITHIAEILRGLPLPGAGIRPVWRSPLSRVNFSRIEQAGRIERKQRIEGDSVREAE